MSLLDPGKIPGPGGSPGDPIIRRCRGRESRRPGEDARGRYAARPRELLPTALAPESIATPARAALTLYRAIIAFSACTCSTIDSLEAAACSTSAAFC